MTDRFMMITLGPKTPHTLWFRESRSQPWQSLGTRPTWWTAWDLMQTSGQRNGNWLCLPKGEHPDKRCKVKEEGLLAGVE